MLPFLGEILPYSMAVALSPLPIIAVVLLLLAPIGVRGAAAFAAARILSLAAIVGGVGLLSHALDEATGSQGPTAITRIILGSVLMALAIVKWRKRPGEDAQPAFPRWMSSIESSSAPAAFRLGLLLTVVNLKELAFASGAGLALGAAQLPAAESVAGAAIFVLLCCSTVILPVLVVVMSGEKSAQPLAATRTWLMRNNSVIIAVILLLIGASMLGGGLSELG